LHKKPWMKTRIISSSTTFLKHLKATKWLHRRFRVKVGVVERLMSQLGVVRALPPGATPSLYLQATSRGYCREGAYGQAQFPHQQHSIPPMIASSTPKIPSSNLLFQPHVPNTEKTSSLILLQCFREPHQRDPIPSARPLLMRALALRNIYRGVGRAIF
jgi:hypothetical protein